jgi:hypothetical protein
MYRKHGMFRFQRDRAAGLPGIREQASIFGIVLAFWQGNLIFTFHLREKSIS